jgi:hypothetical protein
MEPRLSTKPTIMPPVLFARATANIAQSPSVPHYVPLTQEQMDLIDRSLNYVRSSNFANFGQLLRNNRELYSLLADHHQRNNIGHITREDIEGSTRKGQHNQYAEYNQTNCTICLENYEHDSEVRVLRCNHVFHRDCIDSWLPVNPSCPLCRKNIIKETPFLPRRNIEHSLGGVISRRYGEELISYSAYGRLDHEGPTIIIENFESVDQICTILRDNNVDDTIARSCLNTQLLIWDGYFFHSQDEGIILIKKPTGDNIMSIKIA